MTTALLVTGTRCEPTPEHAAAADDARFRAHEHEHAGWILGSRWHYREARRLRAWAALLLGDTDDRAHPSNVDKPPRWASWSPPIEVYPVEVQR